MSEITVYHYTNPSALMKILPTVEPPLSRHPSGLIPRKRFIPINYGDFPKMAYTPVIRALLESEPESWISNPEFPELWWYLMHDVCREEDLVLLCAHIHPSDEAYVVDRAHVEDVLYKPYYGGEEPTHAERAAAYRKYWESRVSLQSYAGGYRVPEVVIWSSVVKERLTVQWIRSVDQVRRSAPRG